MIKNGDRVQIIGFDKDDCYHLRFSPSINLLKETGTAKDISNIKGGQFKGYILMDIDNHDHYFFSVKLKKVR